MKHKYFIFIFSLALFLFAQDSLAERRNPEYITDWYVENFDTQIVVNEDSSLLITEDITADAGDLPNKHGIFRVLPTRVNTKDGLFNTPVELQSIADFNGKPYKYETITSPFDHTITWKIGDPDVTVAGENNYRIVYKVDKAVRFINEDFDELYWNLSGNFWDIDIDNFSAKIIFPAKINKQNATVDYYSGYLGSKEKSPAVNWKDENTLFVLSGLPLAPGQGITVSITFPKRILTPYQRTFYEKYYNYLGYGFFLIPLAVLALLFSVWRKNGKNPKMKWPIPPEFEIPENITPVQMGMVISSGRWKDSFMTAALVDLAVKKVITIKEAGSKVLFFTIKDYIIQANTSDYSAVPETEKAVLEKMLGYGSNGSVKLSDLKMKFYKALPAIKKLAEDDAKSKGWVNMKGQTFSILFLVLGLLFMFFSLFFAVLSFKFSASVFISGIIVLFFSFIMPQRTQKGTDLMFRIKGLERYMRTAEQYRQRFYEKENIFDKLLPYAMVFGIAELWAKKMEQIYGQEYFNNYHPYWFAGSYANFSVSSFTSELNSISSSISSSSSSPSSSSSGSGGGGSSGGGGGGGGGGGW